MAEAATDKPTIFALSSAAGRAGVAVFRVSGPQTRAVLDAMVGTPGGRREAVLRSFKDPANGGAFDRGLAIWFPGPASFTGEDCAELHGHGGRANILSMRQALLALAPRLNIREAEPGEFTRRAFENGKLDLTQAEGLADLIDAETEVQRQQALAQMSGGLSEQVDAWRGRLVEAMAMIEAAIDFSDEEDVAQDVQQRAEAEVAALASAISEALDDQHRGEIVRDGFRVVLVGAPNVGKSSLLNALARREAAIVSDEPGTTRDLVEVRLDLDGHNVVVTDTAGVRETDSSVEREGIRRTGVVAREANLVLWLCEASVADASQPGEQAVRDLDVASDRIRRLVCKADLLSKADRSALQDNVVAVSAHTGEGLSELIALIAQAARELTTGEVPVMITQARHRRCLEHCLRHLNELGARWDELDPELQAETLRYAARDLGRLTGHVDPEELLGVIFGRFCIGK